MSSSSSTPPEPSPSTTTTTTTTPETDINAIRQADYIRFKHYTALTFLVASPILIALPPRRLNNLTALLAGAWFASANSLLREKTGRGIMDRITDGFKSLQTGSLPTEKAQEIQAKLRAARDARIREGEEGGSEESSSLSKEELDKLKARQAMDRSALERVWMAGETEGWKERRLREEQQALDEGKGYGDLIKKHIWEVWNWEKSGKDGLESKEEKK